MRIIKPTENNSKIIPIPEDLNQAIFLAGPCQRVLNDGKIKYPVNWRNNVFNYLKKKNFTGDVIDPTNDYYDTKERDYLTKQVQWEWDGLYKSSAIIFWFDRNEKHPAMTTNIEFGMWYNKDSIYIGCPEEATNNSYIKEVAKYYNKKVYTKLEDLLNDVLKDLNQSERKFFLSDTHLNQKRTLELSKRPFVDLEEMDHVIISNWNKLIRPNDTVVHLGDFGKIEYLKFLNFRRLVFVLGNYENRDKPKTLKDLEDVARSKKIKVYNYEDYSDKPGIYIANRKSEFILKDNSKVLLAHEPINPNTKYPHETKIDKSQKYLYGHIHGRSIYKYNGTDVGIDGNCFKPLDEDYVIWRLNAVKFLDDNIHVPVCID